MEVVFHSQRLSELLRDYHTVTGLRVGVYNTEFEEISACPQRHSRFCQKIRSVPQGLSLCRTCDRAAFLHAKEKGISIYHCHAGLAEAVAPILGQGETVGYVMIGQMRTEQHGNRELTALIQVLDSLGISVSDPQKEFDALPLVEETSLPAFAHILQACASYLWLHRVVEVQYSDLPARFSRYVAENLSQPLLLADISAALGVGKTTLCTAVRRSFGMSAGAWIRRSRIDRAKELLRQSNLSISAIAAQVGIADYNYFSKVFQGEAGVTPSAYRKQKHLDEGRKG